MVNHNNSAVRCDDRGVDPQNSPRLLFPVSLNIRCQNIFVSHPWNNVVLKPRRLAGLYKIGLQAIKNRAHYPVEGG